MRSTPVPGRADSRPISGLSREALSTETGGVSRCKAALRAVKQVSLDQPNREARRAGVKHGDERPRALEPVIHSRIHPGDSVQSTWTIHKAWS